MDVIADLHLRLKNKTAAARWTARAEVLVGSHSPSSLDGVGETKLAREISKRLRATFAKSGSAENYDALTGEGFCDRAYT
jgi:hypothetical protein